MDKAIKVILAILFFICLLDLPYGFYQLVRFTAFVGFVILAYWVSKKENKTEMIIYICLAILFQPLVKLSLGRNIWNIIDVIVGLAILFSLFIKFKSPEENSK